MTAPIEVTVTTSPIEVTVTAEPPVEVTTALTGTFVESGAGTPEDLDYSSSPDIGEALADDDEFPVSNTSSGSSVVSALSRVWTYVLSKMPFASQAEMEAGTETSTRSMSPERVKQAIDALSSGGGDYEDGGEVGGADRTLGNTDNFDLGFLTNNTNRLHIQSDGNVGIGIAAPQNLLDVNAGAVIGSSYAGVETTPTDGLLVEGNVGIGETSPSQALDIAGNIQLSGGIYLGADAEIFLGGDGRIRLRKDGKIDGGGGDQFFFGDYDAWSTSAGAPINKSNNYHVWWDTNDPVRVEFESDAGEMQFYIEGGVGKDSWYGLQESSTHHWSFGQDASDSGNLKFVTGFGLDDGIEALRLLKSDGKVMVTQGMGIGTANPSSELDVVGDIEFGSTGTNENYLKINSSAFGRTSRAILQPIADRTGQLDIRPGTGSSDIPAVVLQTSPTAATGSYSLLFGRGSYALEDAVFHLASSVNGEVNEDSLPIAFSVSNITDGRFEAFRVANSGNIGIGATAPQNKLDVNGAAVVGSSYAGVETAPTDGLLVEGAIESGSGLGLHGVSAPAQAAHIANPTDLASCITAISSINAALEALGVTATS